MPRPIYLTSPVSREGTEALPMIAFDLVAHSIDYQACDTLMFTSKQAVVSAEAIDPSWKQMPAIVIGAATAKTVRAHGGTVLYRPEHFYGQELARDILEHFQAHRVLYLRPKVVSFDSRAFLEQHGYDLKEHILYETVCRPHPKRNAPPNGAIIVFTSPSTIHCFLERFGWQEDYTAVVIGEATRNHLPEGCDCRVAKRPMIDACIDAARQVANEH